MCGLICSLSKNQSSLNIQRVKDQYKEQDHRGRDGFGFVAIKNGKVVYVRSTTEKAILKSLDDLGEASFVMFHHRVPTCNLNAVKANHPIFVANKKNLENKYFIVHNGSIGNSNNLLKEHGEEGFVYNTTVDWKFESGKTIFSEPTDSESLGIEMAKFIEGKTTRIKARGSVATFILQIDRFNNPLSFYFFREGNPIVWYRNQTGIFLASEATGQDLDAKKLYKLDLKTWELGVKAARLSDYSDIGKEDKGEVTPFTKVVRKPEQVIDVKKNITPLVVRDTNFGRNTKTGALERACEEAYGEQNGNTLVIHPRHRYNHRINPLLWPIIVRNRSHNMEEVVENLKITNRSKTYTELMSSLEKIQVKLYEVQGDIMSFEGQGGDEESPEWYDELVEREAKLKEDEREIEEELYQLGLNDFS